MSSATSAANSAADVPEDKLVTEQAANSRRSGVLTATYLGIVAAFISLAGSWTPSFWTDEAATISGAQRGVADLWRMLGNIDVVHGAYYLGMHFWLQIFDASPFSLRLPSAIAVGIAASGVFTLGRRMVGLTVGITAALIFGILPRVTWMGVEGRSYAMTAAAAVWLTVLLVTLRSRRSYRGKTAPGVMLGWSVYSVASGIAIAVNIYMVLLLAAHGATLLLFRRKAEPIDWTWLSCAFASVVIALPVLYAASHQGSQLGGGKIPLVTLLRNVGVNQFFLGDTPTAGADDSLTAKVSFGFGALWPAAAVLLAIVGWGLVILGVVSGNARSVVHERAAVAVRWLLPWLVLPTIVVGLYGIAIGPAYNPRYFSFCTPAIALLMAMGFVFLRRKWVKIVLTSLVIVLTVPVYYSQRTVNAKSSSDWVQVAGFVEQHSERGDAVYFAPRYPFVDTVGQTARGIQVAYPGAFVGLVDVTMSVPPARDDTLTGRSRPLAASVDRLDSVEAVWVIRRNDDPAGTLEADDQLLNSLGFRPQRSWIGPLDSVREFRRDLPG